MFLAAELSRRYRQAGEFAAVASSRVPQSGGYIITGRASIRAKYWALKE